MEQKLGLLELLSSIASATTDGDSVVRKAWKMSGDFAESQGNVGGKVVQTGYVLLLPSFHCSFALGGSCSFCDFISKKSLRT